MNIELNKIDDLNAELSIEINAEDYNPRIEKKLKEYRKNAQIPGFRKGMVPMGHIKKLYGQSLKVQEINEVIHESLYNHLKTSEIAILGEPMISLEKSDKIENWDSVDEVKFIFDLGLRPEIDIKLTKKNKIQYHIIEIKPEQIDHHVEETAKRLGTIEDVEEITEEDLIVTNIKQLDADGNIMEDGIEAKDAFIRVASIVDEEIKKTFIGKKKEDVFIFNPKKAFQNDTEISSLLKIEKADAENLDCDFQITINQIRRVIAAELNADLFEKAYKGEGIANIDQFRERIQKDLEANNIMYQRGKFQEVAQNYMIEKYAPQLPEEFLKRWLVETNEELTAEKLEDMWGDYRKSFQWQLIIDKIAIDNDIKVEENDVLEKAKDEVRMAFSYYNMSNIPEETLISLAQSKLEKEDQWRRYASIVIEDKVVDKIMTMVNIEEVTVTEEVFREL
ncbi:MAG: trigger factor [Salinivirgaceae bacterium]|nr:trigger factor [Salinivirgaceae bacterium]MDY0279743.1 trigger factor [Salinivirgaceae bacterium]